MEDKRFRSMTITLYINGYSKETRREVFIVGERKYLGVSGRVQRREKEKATGHVQGYL